MTAEERIAELELRWNWNQDNKLTQEVRWLIDQAKEKILLEQRYGNTGSMFGRQNHQLLIDENIRLRKALQFYADENNYTDIDDRPNIARNIISIDQGFIARLELGEA